MGIAIANRETRCDFGALGSSATGSENGATGTFGLDVPLHRVQPFGILATEGPPKWLKFRVLVRDSQWMCGLMAWHWKLLPEASLGTLYEEALA